uniref:Transmembrane protein 180 n=1 Tax=Panagrolaimus sp. JU765 TaxID=591449 RepID=A0AC34QNW4_9BILA
MFYYVKVFLNVFKVNEYWFNVAQFLYMIWNALNDPLFGYLQDVGGTWMKSRSKIFTWVGPPLSLSFLVLWFPWGDENSPPWVEGLHLIVALFLYDAFFSCVGVAWGALYTESTRDHRKRVKALKYSQLAVLCSVNVIVIAEKVSHSLDNFVNFQILCGIISGISCVCFYLTGKLSSVDPSLAKEKLIESEKEQNHSLASVLNLTKELLGAQDLQLIVLTNFIHTCRSVAHLNFASIAVELIIPQSVLAKGSWQLSAFFAISTLLPQILVIANEKLIVRNGAYHVMLFSFFCSVLSGCLYTLSWSPYVVLFFMIIDSITVHSTAPLFNIFLAEFIEDDALRNSRRTTLSSVVFSLNALIIKPASSVAPVVIVYLLNRSGYEIYQHNKEKTAALSLCMLRVIFAIPMFLGAIQLAIFRRYSIRHHQCNPTLPI